MHIVLVLSGNTARLHTRTNVLQDITVMWFALIRGVAEVILSLWLDGCKINMEEIPKHCKFKESTKEILTKKYESRAPLSSDAPHSMSWFDTAASISVQRFNQLRGTKLT